MSNLGCLTSYKNAGFRAFYRFAEGLLPLDEHKNPNPPILVNREIVQKLLELMSVLKISEGPSLNIARYKFTNMSDKNANGVRSMTATFSAKLSSDIMNGPLIMIFKLENPAGVWCVREVSFPTTPILHEKYFTDFPTSYELWS